jgi:hypothetical protein
MAITTAASGVAAPEAFSVIGKTGSGERGTGIVALSSLPASPIVADMTAGAERLVQELNREHALAQAAKDSAVEHAIRCGQLLLEQKARLEHGDFQPWIEAHCRFAYSTAARYMTAARRISQGVEISSLSSLFPSRRTRKALPAPESSSEQPAAPSPTTNTAPTPPEEMTPERAIAMLARDRKRFARILDAERAARRELTRAQAVHNNAVATVLAAAKKLEQSATTVRA